MKKLIIIACLFFGLGTRAQIGDLYIYNFSSYDISYQLLAFPDTSCYPTFSYANPPASDGFKIAAGEQHTFSGFVFPTTPNFPAPPAGGWKWGRKISSTSVGFSPAAGYTGANAQTLAGNTGSAIQARWKYFKCNDQNGYNYAGVGFSSNCLSVPAFWVSYDINVDISTVGGNTIVTINDN